MPLHKGHCHLIQTAINNCDLATVVVCSIPSEPIDGHLRYWWVSAEFPNANVLHLDKSDMPQEPKYPGEIEFWDTWISELKRLHPDQIDHVFSSEPYGHELASHLARYQNCFVSSTIVDQPRITVPISGTAVRNDPYKNWDFIPDRVKPFFVKRILITGPESCGKTTMCEILSKVFNTNWAKEWARENWDSISGWNFNIDDLDKVAAGQFDYQLEAIKTANKIYFSDTSALETHIYAEEYLNQTSPYILHRLGQLRTDFDMVILLTPRVKFVQDGLRRAENKRWELFDRFMDIADRLELPVIVIDGDKYEDRVLIAIEHCKKLLEGK